MGKIYDNWGRLVEAVVRREQLRRLSLADSRSPSIRSIDSDYTLSSSSSSSSHQLNLSFTTTPSPSPQLKFGKQRGTNKVLAKTRNAVWKGLSIFRGLSSKNKKENEREAEWQWAKAQKTLQQMEHSGFFTKQNNVIVFQHDEMWKRKAEITRLRELHTLKGHIEALAKTRGIDLDSIHHYYTV